MGRPVYKSTSNPPDETSNPTSSSTASSATPRAVSRSRINSRTRTRTRNRLQQRRRAQLSLSNSGSYLVPAEFLSSSYNPSNARTTPLKEQRLVLVLRPNTTSDRPKGSYTMSLATYSNKMGLSFPSSILISLSSNPKSRNDYIASLPSFVLDEAPTEDPGFASDNESTTSEDSILSDPEWISSNRELAMELLLGSSEDEFFGSLLGTENFEGYDDPMEGSNNGLYEDDGMDLDMSDADEADAGMDREDDNGCNEAHPFRREVDENYD